MISIISPGCGSDEEMPGDMTISAEGWRICCMA